MPNSILDLIAAVFDEAVRTRELPESWYQSTGIPLYKKGDETDAYNYRIISLTDTISKTYERALLARAGPTLTRSLHKWQHGFQTGRSTQMAGLVLAATCGMGLTQAESDRHGKTYAAFLDIRKAFPTTFRPAMLHKLHEAGVHGHLFRGIAATYNKVTSCISIGGESSQPYNVELGVREGSVLSPIMYITFLDGLLQRLHQAEDDTIMVARDPTVRVAGMAYVDDLVLVSATPEGLQRALNIAADYANEHCFQYSQDKSKVVVFGSTDNEPDVEWTLPAIHHKNPGHPDNTDTIAQTDHYTYLGTEFHANRTWNAQFSAAAKKFRNTCADKWEDAGGVALGVDEVASLTLWGSLVAATTDTNPLVLSSTLANRAALAEAQPLHHATTSAQQASLGGRRGNLAGATLATGIRPLESRLAAGAARGITRIMEKPVDDPIRKTLVNMRDGAAGQRYKDGLSRAAHITGTGSALAGQHRNDHTTTYRAEHKEIAQNCIAHDTHAIRAKATRASPHIHECYKIYMAVLRAHRNGSGPTTGLIGHSRTKGSPHGRSIWRQIRAACTGRNDYTKLGPHGNRSKCNDCPCSKDTNQHWVIHCPKHSAPRERFHRETGIRISVENYYLIIALDAARLGINPETLSTSLFRYLSCIARHTPTTNASVAPTRCNQGARGHC